MTENSQHLFDELDKKLKKLEEQIKPKPKETVTVKQIITEQKPVIEDVFKQKLLTRLNDEKMVEVYQKKDGELVVVSIKNIEGWLLLSLSLNIILLLFLVTKIFGIW